MPVDARHPDDAPLLEASEFLRRVAARIRVQRDAQPQWRRSGREAALYLDEAAAAVSTWASTASAAPYAAPPDSLCRPTPETARRTGRRPSEVSSLVLF